MIVEIVREFIAVSQAVFASKAKAKVDEQRCHFGYQLTTLIVHC
jgi:hypothetical protein